MTRFIWLAGLFLSLIAPRPADAANLVIEKAIDGFVRPAYGHLAETTKTMAMDIARLCTAPAPAALATSRADFRQAVEAWSQIEIIRFGPVTERNRLERLLFWPDRKGIGLKQVQAALATRDAGATDVTQLASKSIAMQGFGALEYVLFGTDADGLAIPGDGYRCAYAKAIALNIAGIASDVDAGWRSPEGFAKTWSNPASDNEVYHSDDEALTELLDTLVQGLEMLRDVRINGFLGKEPAGDKPRQAIFWRSETTVFSLAGNLAGMRAILAQSGLKDNLPADSQWIVESVDAQFANGATTLAPLTGPVDAILADPRKRGKLSFARDVTTTLSATIGTRLAGELGLTAGFSSLDGD